MSVLAAIALAAPLVVGPSAPGDIAVDAFFQEWDGRPVALVDRAVKGDHGGPKDLSARLQLAFDADHLYVAVQAVDDVFQPGAASTGDRLEIVFAPEGKAPRRLRVLLNQLELGIAPTLELDGKPYRHGKVVGTTRRDGWAVEAQVRLQDLPGVVGPDVPVVALIDDADADSVRIEATIANAPVDAERRPTLATFRFDPTGDAERLYLSDRGSPTVLARHGGQLTGDPLHEALLITAEDIVVFTEAYDPSGGYFLMDSSPGSPDEWAEEPQFLPIPTDVQLDANDVGTWTASVADPGVEADLELWMVDPGNNVRWVVFGDGISVVVPSPPSSTDAEVLIPEITSVITALADRVSGVDVALSHGPRVTP